jgi:3-oxoacyl-[acyl-carrier-protein] synthase III
MGRAQITVTQKHLRRARIVSVGGFVPDRIMTNADFERSLDTSDEWIRTRTGIRERRIVDADGDADAPTSAFELGGKASLIALDKANCSPEDIDGIICATFSPDFFFPSTACKIQQYIGNTVALAFDVSAACAGFVYALSIANSMIVSGQCKKMLVVGAEVISKTLDWTDRGTCILFGDGAGAVVLEAAGDGRGDAGEYARDAKDDSDVGILSTYLKSNGAYGDILYLPAWGEKRFMRMNGNEVYKHAVRLMGDATQQCLRMAGLSFNDVDLLIPHQANIRIIDAMARHMKLPKEKVVTNLDRYGNTSSASIPLALEDAWKQGRIKPGTIAVFTSLGGGLAWGSAVVRF